MTPPNLLDLPSEIASMIFERIDDKIAISSVNRELRRQIVKAISTSSHYFSSMRLRLRHDRPLPTRFAIPLLCSGRQSCRPEQRKRDLAVARYACGLCGKSTKYVAECQSCSPDDWTLPTSYQMARLVAQG